jgi:outer membrane protein assembly factor BamB
LMVHGLPTSSAAEVDSSAWTVYHHDLAGRGTASSVSRIDTSTPAWTSPRLDGEIFGEPLGASGRVYVATENDTVYALSATTGKILWSRHVGTPVPSQSLPCGNITPTVGITGTPAIDQHRSELFAVAEELRNGSPAHVLVALDTTSGQIEMTRVVDPPGATPAALLQRTGLTLDANRVLFGFGGNYGDCSTYRGSLVAVSESAGRQIRFTVDVATGESQGAIWMGGAAPAVDSAGRIWVGVGNGSVTSSAGPYDYSDSVLELSSSLHLLQYFAPSAWASNNASDLDLSTEPALLPGGLVVEAGKSRVAYLLSSSHLGGIGGQQTQLASACGDAVDGGTAVIGTVVYLPCLSGIVALKVDASAPSLHARWRSQLGGGPPIVAAGRVWTIGQNGILYGLSPSTGALLEQTSIGVPANHFPTPSVADGVLLAASADHVVAFKAAISKRVTTTATISSSPATAASTVTSTSAPAPVRARNTGGVGDLALIAAVVGAAGAIGGAFWLRRGRKTT